ncbi:MAG: MFS transporter [Acetobacteraceae bacterium]
MTDQPIVKSAGSSSLFRTVVPPIILPVFLAAADGTVVATALPAIAADLGEVERLSWVVVVNLIASTIAAPACGRLADLFGRRRMMLIALLFYAAASTFTALAPGFELLLVGRALQGLGGGGLMTLAQALIGENVPPRERGTYQGYLSANIVTGSTIGPVAGGLMTQAWGWRSVFLAYVPLCLIATLLVLRLPKGQQAGGRVRLDLAGMVLLTSFVVPLLMGVSQLQRLDPGTLPRLAGLLTVAGIALAVLLWHQRRSSAPLLPIALFRIPAFWRSDVMAFCSGASLTGLMTFLPIYLQVVTGASPAGTGLLLIPLTGSVASGSVLTGWLISRTGRTAIFPAIGLSVTAVTLVGLAIWAPEMSQVQLSWALAVGGVCQGSAMLTAQVTVQAVSGARNLGAAAASAQLSRSLGSAFGAAAAGAVLFGILSATSPDTATLFFEMVRRGPSILSDLPAARQAVVQAEVAQAFRGVFLTIACFSVTIVAMAITLPVRRL